eukprot:3579718-Rhodomonas_salina.1
MLGRGGHERAPWCGLFLAHCNGARNLSLGGGGTRGGSLAVTECLRAIASLALSHCACLLDLWLPVREEALKGLGVFSF